ncbi:MAG: TVP38/TMEM64 family protein [Cyanophyceae cyanobacterium]
MTRTKKNSILKWLVVAVVVAGIIVLAKMLGIADVINSALQNTLQWIDSLGSWGPTIFIAIYIVAAVLLVSGALLTLGAGVLFGVIQGSIYVSIAATLGATAAFLIGRYFVRGWVAKQIENRPKFGAIDSAVAREGWKIVGLTRLSPVFPYVFLNYAYGVTQVSLRDFFFASWIGMMPGTVMYVYLGSLAGNLASLATGGVPEGEQASTVQWVIRIVGFVATVAVTLYVTKVARKALDSEIDQESSSGFDEDKATSV